MADAPRPRILVVDDEEAILETMTFTFEDDYEVHTSTDARRALEILDEHAPIAVVLTDQRMPNMSGVEFLREVWQRHPTTMRIILTGFADMGAIIEAINDGHVYAYIAKPWEPDHLKQVMKQAVNHHQLTLDTADEVDLGDTGDAAQLAGDLRVDHACQLRARQRRPELDFTETTLEQMGTSMGARLVQREEERLVHAALAKLPLEMHIAVELYYFEEMSATEVAMVLGVPEGTVRSRLRRALDQLREALAELGAPRELFESSFVRGRTP